LDCLKVDLMKKNQNYLIVADHILLEISMVDYI